MARRARKRPAAEPAAGADRCVWLRLRFACGCRRVHVDPARKYLPPAAIAELRRGPCPRCASAPPLLAP